MPAQLMVHVSRGDVCAVTCVTIPEAGHCAPLRTHDVRMMDTTFSGSMDPTVIVMTPENVVHCSILEFRIFPVLVRIKNPGG